MEQNSIQDIILCWQHRKGLTFLLRSAESITRTNLKPQLRFFTKTEDLMKHRKKSYRSSIRKGYGTSLPRRKLTGTKRRLPRRDVTNIEKHELVKWGKFAPSVLKKERLRVR